MRNSRSPSRSLDGFAGRRLAAMNCLADVRGAARERLPRSVSDYLEGGSDGEESLDANTEAFRRRRYVPRAFTDVSNTDTSVEILGRPAGIPLALAPTGYTRMFAPGGETAVARAAGKASIPYVLSTMASTSIEDLSAETSDEDVDLWFQLYVWKDRVLTLDLVARAWEAGYRVLEVAVDTAVAGRRLRDVSNGLTIPPRLRLKTILDIGIRPRYWTGLAAGPRLEFANLNANPAHSKAYTIENITEQFDPGVTWKDFTQIRAAWPGKLVVKGPLGVADALLAQQLGADGVHLSNHGGRQLDRTVAPLDLVEPVRQQVGEDFTILIDSGVRHGSDIATAVALGADMCLIGRPYLWGLAAAGGPGVDRVIELFRQEYQRTLQLLGYASTRELRTAGTRVFESAASQSALEQSSQKDNNVD